MEEQAAAALGRCPPAMAAAVESFAQANPDFPGPGPPSHHARRPLPAQRPSRGGNRRPDQHRDDLRCAASTIRSGGEPRSLSVFEETRAVFRSKLQAVVRVNWSDVEVQRAAKVIAELDSYVGPRRLTGRTRSLRLAVSEINGASDGIWGSFPVTFIRHLCRELGFEEHRVFKWHLEHKLMQALVLNRYVPGTVPVTRGIAEFKRDAGHVNLQAALEAEFPSGFFLKPALGDSSGECDTPDRNERILAAWEEQSAPR